MTTLRHFMMMKSINIIQKFLKQVLQKFWNDWNILLWNVNKPLLSPIGSGLLLFIKNTTVIVKFLCKNFEITPTIDSIICKVLLLLGKE